MALPEFMMSESQNICMKAKEVLEEQIGQSREELPFSLKVKHIVELTNSSKPQVYEMLDRDIIPGAKKVPGLGWRIPRDVFLSWWYGNKLEQKLEMKY